ncbi:MAG: hypothetical protein ABR549_08070, partial [Mycobacteriales bacterium]
GLVYEFKYHLVDYNNVNVATGADEGNTVSYESENCPTTQNQVQLPKAGQETTQPVYAGGGNWVWDLRMPNSGVVVCDHMIILTNDGFTHFDADIQITP